MMRINPSLMVGLLLLGTPVLRAQLVGVEYDTGRFYSISAADGSLSLIGETGISGIGALDFNPQDGALYGFTNGEDATLYRFTIPQTMDQVVAEPIGELGFFMFEGSLLIAPSGTAYAVNGGNILPVLMNVDLETGAGTIINPLADRHDIAGLGWRSDGFLVALDSTDNVLLQLDPATAEVSTIEQVGPAIGTVGGLAMQDDSVGYFVTAGPLAAIAGSNSLYSFDPISGEQLFITDYETRIFGVGFGALSFIPEPATLVLLSLGGLALIRRR